ncbi:MAG: hypothetical protein AAF997_02590 [Myxococcota bacterium]
MLHPRDEHWHEPSSAKHWNESFYFNAFDTERRWACAVRVGATPGIGERDGFVCLYLPDGTTAFIETAQPSSRGVDLIRSESLDFVCVEPFGKWRVRFDGSVHHFRQPASPSNLERTRDTATPTKRLALDLEVAPLHRAIRYDERSLQLRPLGDLTKNIRGHPWRSLRQTVRGVRMLPSMVGAHHYEQSTRVVGLMTFDGKTSTIEGYGQRDHSWGVRDMRVPKRWRWISCQFGDELCFNAVAVDVLLMRVQSGFVLRNGVVERIGRWSLDEHHQTHRFWPDQIRTTLTTEGGHLVELGATITDPLPVVARTAMRNTIVTAARARFEWGGRAADGMVECMEQLW